MNTPDVRKTAPRAEHSSRDTTQPEVTAPAQPDERMSPHQNGEFLNGSVSLHAMDVTTNLIFEKPEVNKNQITIDALTYGEAGRGKIERDYENKTDLHNIKKKVAIMAALRRAQEAKAATRARAIEYAKVRDAQPSTIASESHWNQFTLWEWIVVIFLGIGSIAMLGASINTSTMSWYTSGRPGFENIWRCVFFTLIATFLPLTIKVLGSEIESKEDRKKFRRMTWIAALVMGIIWSIQVSGISTIAETLDETIAKLAQGSQASFLKNLSDSLFVAVQIISEALIAAGCWLKIDEMIREHRSSVPEDNPAFLKLEEKVGRLAQREDELDFIIGHLEGQLEQYPHMKHEVVSEALRIFDAALASSKQQRDHQSQIQAILKNSQL